MDGVRFRWRDDHPANGDAEVFYANEHSVMWRRLAGGHVGYYTATREAFEEKAVLSTEVTSGNA